MILQSKYLLHKVVWQILRLDPETINLILIDIIFPFAFLKKLYHLPRLTDAEETI